MFAVVNRPFVFVSYTIVIALLICGLTGCSRSGAGGDRPEVDLHEELERKEQLDRSLEMTCARIESRSAILLDLASDKIELLEAASRLRILDCENAQFNWDLFRSKYPGNSDEERFCRKVIEAVKLSVSPNSDSTRKRVQGLEGELRQLIHDGKLRLPEVAESNSPKVARQRIFKPER